MDKFTIVIPTIWKDSSIFEMLDKYYTCESISEVILINNNKENTPNFPKHKKLLYVEPYENIFVNPAWNMGVRLASNDNIIIANDDIIYNIELLTNILNMLDKQQSFKDIGFIGMELDNYDLKEQSEDMILKAHQGKPAWACLFAFHKSNWKEIPNQLKIYYGDDFIKMNNLKIIDLCGFKVETKMSVSADTRVDWVKKVTDNDRVEWLKIINNIYANSK